MYVSRKIMALVVLAFVLRVCVRLYIGADDYFVSGYSFFFDVTQSITAGKGIGLGGEPETFRVPFYPIVLALVTMGRKAFLTVILFQSLIGATTVWCTGYLAKTRFGGSAPVTAAAIAALYPYYVMHDTALGETSLFTLLTVISVLLLLRAQVSGSARWAACAGTALGVDLMTRVTIAPFAVVGAIGIAWLAVGSRGQRLRSAACCGLATLFVVTPWLLRTYCLTGSIVLSTETGFELWNGNNENTFSHYPNESIDRSEEAALATLTPEEWTTKRRLGIMGEERWYANRAVSYIRQHPWLTFYRSMRKLGAAFGVLMSPRHNWFGNMAHALSYGPVMVLGLCGMWIRRRQWREDAVIYAAFATFIAVTAVFFGHTTHRSYLDVYSIVFATGALDALRAKYSRESGVIQSVR
jgi:4-amino-4-deoxy-L-arabinose transferase-like glycosyltransferase